jgi:hypothetical protein
VSTKNRDNKVGCARCRHCDHDLVAKYSGKVYCTNRHCRLSRHEHPMGSNVSFRRAALHRSYETDPDL